MKLRVTAAPGMSFEAKEALLDLQDSMARVLRELDKEPELANKLETFLYSGGVPAAPKLAQILNEIHAGYNPQWWQQEGFR